mgnify:CR=1 FL=1
MGIKDLFKSSDKSSVYSDYETEKQAFESVESMTRSSIFILMMVLKLKKTRFTIIY